MCGGTPIGRGKLKKKKQPRKLLIRQNKQKKIMNNEENVIETVEINLPVEEVAEVVTEAVEEVIGAILIEEAVEEAMEELPIEPGSIEVMPAEEVVSQDEAMGIVEVVEQQGL